MAPKAKFFVLSLPLSHEEMIKIETSLSVCVSVCVQISIVHREEDVWVGLRKQGSEYVWTDGLELKTDQGDYQNWKDGSTSSAGEHDKTQHMHFHVCTLICLSVCLSEPLQSNYFIFSQFFLNVHSFGKRFWLGKNNNEDQT